MCVCMSGIANEDFAISSDGGKVIFSTLVTDEEKITSSSLAERVESIATICWGSVDQSYMSILYSYS